MAWRAASLLLVAAIFVGHVQATWKWENNSTHRPASASSVVTSSSSISTSSSSSVSIGPQHDLLVVPTTLVHSETSGQDGLPHTEQEGRRPTQKSSRALEDDPSDAGTRDLEAAPSDTEPRFIGRLKKKLCSVGLGFNCGHKVYKPAAQHYGKPADPHEIQYVQPVEIRPVGKPIPAIPYTHGTSYGNSHGSGYGSGHGGGHGSGHGGGHGSGHGGGHGSGHGGGHGDGHGGGHGSGHGGGHGSGHGGGHGSGHGGGHGSGHGGGYGSGHGGGHDSGHGGSHGSGHGSGYGNGHGNSFGNSHGGVFDVSHSNDYGNSYDNGHDNGHSSIIHGDDLYGLTGHGGGGGDGGYLPETGLGGYSGGSSHGYPAPQDLFPYSAASAPSDIYGPPKASSVVHDAPFYGAPQARPSRYDEEQPPVSGYVASQGPSSGYVAPQAPSSGYVATQAPSSGYVAPQAPSSGYVAPQAPSSGYVAPQAPSSGYVASQAPSSGYDTPLDTSSGYVAPKTPLPLSGSLKSSGGSTQAVKHIHIHQHTYKFDASDAIGVGGFGVSGGYDANLIAAKENVDSKAPVLESERNSDYSANSLPEPQDVFILAPSAEYGTGSDGGVDLVRGVREPTRVGQPRDIGCTCVPIEQCPQQLDVGTPFAREDLSAIQDPRNSPSLNGVLSNASHPLLRRRRDTQPPFDQIAVPSQDQLLKQSKELFPETSRLDGDPFAFDPDASQSDTCRVVQPSPYPNIKIVSTDLTVQGADDGPVGPQASNTEPFLAPTPVPVDLSAGQVDASLVRSQREGAVQDVSLQYQDVLRSNKEVVFKDCKGVQKKVRSRRDTEEDKGTRGEPSPRFLGGLLGGVASGSGLDGIKKPGFAPSFGINFGSLPTGSGYGPYGGNNNPLGLDLGPVSINPFVGFKLASLDGRPILNPSLDLLVTPNAKGVHALKGLKDKFKHDLDSYKGYGGGYGGGYYPGGYYPGGHYSGGGYPYGGYYPSSPYYQYGGYPQSYYPHSQTYAPKPIYTPPKPVYTPPKPVYTPPKPVYRPPSYTPSYYRPKPIANYGNQYTRPKPSYSHHHKPVEVLHHHEHTHYHDYDRYDDSYSDSFSPSFSPYGRSESLKGDRSSISPSTLPLSASSRLPSSSSSRLPPIAASASRLPSSRLLPHSSTSSSFSPSTPSSFKGSASSPVHSTFSVRSDTSKSPSGFKFPDT